MNFTAEIQIMPLPEIVEPQGRTLQKHIHQLPIEGVQRIRVGKFIKMDVEADSKQDAQAIVNKACEKLIAHPLIETYSFTLLLKEDPAESTPEEEE